MIGAGRSCAVFAFWLDGGTFVCVIPHVVVLPVGEAEERASFVLVTATSLFCALLRSSGFSLLSLVRIAEHLVGFGWLAWIVAAPGT